MTETRIAIPALDEILGVQFPVLDRGFVRLVDYMGGDQSVVQAARVSYGAGTKTVHEDRGLLRYLMRHRHTTPFEMAELKLHVRVPMDHWRQWIRHRMASVNEYSTRYSIAIDDRQETPAEKWRVQSGKNKQGSTGYLGLAEGEVLSNGEKHLHRMLHEEYERRIALGVAREQARKDLPLSTYTEAYWKIDLHNLFHFLGLRMDAHAQEEIRGYATTIGEQIVAKWVPDSWQAFLDYRLWATHLSRLEIEVIRAINTTHNGGGAIAKAVEFGWLRVDDDGGVKANREREECEQKLAALGFNVPWAEAA